MKTKKQKGFTLVELVIVIAVIAILAAVLIPTFSSLVKKANESADIQATREMNTALALDGAATPTSLVGLYDALEEVGLTAKDYTPLYKNRCFYWVKDINQVIYYDNETKEIVFPKNVTETNGWYSLDGSFDSSSSSITSFPDEESGKYTFNISSASDFVKAAELTSEKSASDLSGKTIEIVLNADIDLQGADVYFSNKNTTLNVVYKSNGNQVHTISGLCVSDKHGTSGVDSEGNTSNTYGHSLFYIIDQLTVENVNIKDSAITGYETSQAAFFASQVSGNVSFKNVTVTDCDVQGEKKVGILVAYCQGKITFDNVSIINCNTYAKEGECGVVLGFVQPKAVSNSEKVITGTVTITNSTSNLAKDTKVVTKKVTDGKEYTVTEFTNSNGNTEHKVTTALYGFYETISDSIIHAKFDDGTECKILTAIDSQNVNTLTGTKTN